MSMEKVIQEIESKKESAGIISYEIQGGSISLKLKKGYEGLGLLLIQELSKKYESIVKGGNIQTG